MERDKIERRDFPSGRRGYDPAAVDEHLRRVADEFEAQVHAPAAPLSGAAAEQVRAILEAAERSAAALQARAGEEAAGHVSRVQASAAGLIARLDELEDELNRLLGSLRASGERLAAGLEELKAEARSGASPPTDSPPAPTSDPPAPAVDSPAPAADSPQPAADSPQPATDPPAAPSAAASDGAPPAPATDAAPAADGPPARKRRARRSPRAAADPPPVDDAGARLAALNMALGGSPREETARYLTEHFGIADPSALLDDVYARAGR